MLGLDKESTKVGSWNVRTRNGSRRGLRIWGLDMESTKGVWNLGSSNLKQKGVWD